MWLFDALLTKENWGEVIDSNLKRACRFSQASARRKLLAGKRKDRL